MKKSLFILSVLLISVLALSACAGGNNQNQTPAAGEGAGLEATPGAGDVVESPVVESPMPTETVAEAQPDLTATPAAGEGDVAGDEEMATFNTSNNRFSVLSDFPVRDSNDEELGDVEGFVVDRQSGQLLYAIVGSGGILGIGENDILVPWGGFNLERASAASVGENDRAFYLNIDRETLTNAPNFVPDQMPDVNAADWDADIRTYWSSTSVPAPAASDPANLVVLRDVTDLDLQNATGEDLGDIEDFIIEPASGVIQYALLATGGALDLGECYLPVPWNSLQWEDVMTGAGAAGEDAANAGQATAENAAAATPTAAAGSGAAGNAEGEDVVSTALTGPYIAVLPVTTDSMVDAPCFESLDEIPDPAVAGWDADISTFWAGVDLSGGAEELVAPTATASP